MEENKYEYIPAEKFNFVNLGEKISDLKFEDKPIGYFKDAWLRFKKSKASVVGGIIIILVFLYAFIAPVLIKRDPTFMCTVYAKKPARIEALANIGIANGKVSRSLSERGLIKQIAVGISAEDAAGKGNITIAEALDSKYQPVISYKYNGKNYDGKIDSYMEVGFIYRSVEQQEYAKMAAWQEETGIQLLYPLVENNEYCLDKSDANYWYKTDNKGNPVTTKSGSAKTLKFSDDLVLEDNYKRDAKGNVLYYEFTGGGDVSTAQYKVRVLYYNYYQYLYDQKPDYFMGTDAQGYDLALRLAGGIKLSLLIAVCVSVINFVLGTIYGAIEGYYGGIVDLIMERISDILYDIPFIVLATLFQIHLASKVGAVPTLLFTYVLTGWIGTASLVRTQFYRFKNQEYVMAARTLGARDARIIWKHIYPNSLGTIITASALDIPYVIYSESMLSYLGIVKLGTAQVTSLGTLLSDASSIWTNYPHLMIVPALTISLLMISFNLFGNGLRDAFNPALRGTEE